MDDLDAWLGTSLGPENLRAEVRQACGGSLEDLRSCELEDLESELSLSTWPPLERQRFLSAWRGLSGESDVDEAAADDAAADTDEEPAAAPRPPSPAPAPEPVSPPPPADDAPRYAVGDQVEARWKGGERYYPALVLVARVDGSVDLRYTDDDTESRVHPSLLRPLSRRRGRARRAPPPPAPVAESSDAESEPAPAEPEPLASPMAEEPSDAESEPAEPAPSPMAEDEPVAPESEPVPAPPAPVPAPMAPEPDDPAPEDPNVKAGKERSRREQSEMDRALEAGRGAARAAAEAVDAAEGSAVEATSNASEAVAADREKACDRAVAAAAGARAHAAGSCRTATATALDALDKAEQTEPPAAAPAPAPADAPPAPVAVEPEPTEPPPISTPAVELAPPVAAPSPSPVAPDEPAPMDTTRPPPDADAMDVDAPDRTVDAAETRSVLERLRTDMVRTVDIASRNMRPPNVDWRIGHTYSFLGAMEALGAGDTRAALAEALIRGQRGELEPSTVRRAVARILGGNLRTLERFQHTLRPTAAPITSAATVSWYDPASGVDLYAYSSCGAAAKEWGLTTELVRDCVEGNVDWNGLHFRRQTRWPVPAGSERVSQGVYRVGDDRYRVQLGHDWGFLGNFDSAGAADLIHEAAWERLRHARRILQAHTLGQLTEGAKIDLAACYVLLRRIALGTSFPSAFAVRKHRVPFAPFDGPHDAYFVSRSRGREIRGLELLNASVHPPQRELTWWDPRDPSRGLCAQRLVARDGNRAIFDGYHYQLVRRSGGDAVAVNGNDASLVQLWRRTAVPAPVAPAPVVPPPPADWAQCATCDKWRVLPANTSAASLSDDWKCGDIGVSCSKVACSLEDADCACHRRGWDGEVVLLTSAGAITATYCSPAGAAAAHGIMWQDAQRRCSSKALTKPKIESATPPILRYATAWDGEIKRREAAKAAAEKRRVAQQAAAARQRDAAEAAAAASAAMAALRKPAEWAQCSSCERWRLLPEGASAASDAWTCADVGVSCEKTQCAAENPECECHAPGFSLDREVIAVSPEGRVVERYCSAQGAGAALGMARSRAAECLNTKQVSKVNNVLRYAKDWAEEVQSRRAEARPRVTCTLCRKVRVVPPGITIEDEEDWKCDDAPENWFAGAARWSRVRGQRLSCETRECSTGMPHCPCQGNVGRGVDQTRDDGVIVRHCSVAACARALYPDAPDAELWKSNVVSCIEKGKPYAHDKENEEKGGAFKGSLFTWGRQDCAYCASGARPETILLCDGWNCANEAHFHCAGLDAIPSGKWFCCEACEQNPAPEERVRSAPTGDRRGRCGACDGCLADECGTCKWCLDQTKRGGANTLRRPCIFRRCEQVYDDSKARFRAARGSATTTAAEEPDEPGPGTRVWALFDDDSLPQSWWGGTIISISGVAEEMRYEVVFDDGERQGVYAAHVFHSPPDERLPVSGPNAKAKAVLEKALPPKKTPAPRKRPAPKKRPAADAQPPRPQMPTGNCPVCYEPFQSGEVKSFNCGHHLCGTCSEALARHKAEQGVNTTRQGVQVSCPLCRKRARVGLA